jgi:hypothetical protein
MKHTYFLKNAKRSLAIIAASAMLMSIPVAAHQGEFSFNLTFNSDNDNDQSEYVYRDEIFLGKYGYVTVLKQSNANNNLKVKLLKYYADSETIGGTATNTRTYTNSYYKSNLALTYKSNYIAKVGAYKLYGYCAKSNSSASGNWRP